MSQPESPQPPSSDSSAQEQMHRELVAARMFGRHTRSVTNVRQRVIAGAPQLGSAPCIAQSFQFFDSNSTRPMHRETVNTLSVLPGEFDHPSIRYGLNRMLMGRMVAAGPDVSDSTEHFAPEILDTIVGTIGNRGWGQYSQLPHEQTARIVIVSPANPHRPMHDTKHPSYRKWADYQLNAPNRPIIQASYILGANGACIDYQSVFDLEGDDGVTHSSVVLSDGAMLNPQGIDPDLFEQHHTRWRWFAEHFTDAAR